MRYRISRRDPPAPVWSATPAPSFTQGVSASYSLSAISSDPGSQPLTYTSVGAALPSGVTINNSTKALDYNGSGTPATTTGLRLRASNGANSSDSALFSLTIAASSAVVDVTTFQVTSPTGGLDLPWTFGHAFKQGDVPTGTYLVANQANFSADPQTYWPDGSVKHAIISGRNTLVGGVASTITLRRTGVNPAAPGPGLASLQSNMPTVTIAGGVHTTTLNSLLGTPFRVVSTSEQMSNWIFREAVSGSDHLVVWCDVRYYAGGAIEIFPWVENAYFTVASPTNDVRTWTVTIAGVSRFSQSIDIKHHTRIPLITGRTDGYWVGTDPQITPTHNKAYFFSTKLTPNLGYGVATAATLNALQQTYTPNTLAGEPSNMTGSGGSGSVMRAAPAFYLTTGDSRAYKAAVTHGLSAGSWSIHFRDNTTNEPPIFSSYANSSLNSQGTPFIPEGSGATNGTYGVSHLPSFAYVPYLITGRYFFLEESMFWAVRNYLGMTAQQRRGADYVMDGSHGGLTTRGAAWAINVVAQTLAICPTGHSTYNQWKTALENTMRFLRAKYILGTSYTGTTGTDTFGTSWVNTLGWISEYSPTAQSSWAGEGTPEGSWMGAAYQQNYFTVVLGYTSDLGLPISAQGTADHIAVRDFSYSYQVQRAGDGLNGRYNWRRIASYAMPIGTDDNGLPPDVWYTSNQMAAAAQTRFGLASLPATLGLSLLNHSNDTDINSSSSTLPYASAAISGLAMAVDHGASGASEGWTRVSSASNFMSSSAFSPFLNEQAPQEGVVPRSAVGLPSWVPSPGQFANLGTSTMAAVDPPTWPGEGAGPFWNWSGGAFIRDFGTRGGYAVHGSGHVTGPLYAGVWVFDLGAQVWVGRNVPSQVINDPGVGSYAGYNEFFESLTPATLGHTYPPHTYDGLVEQPTANGGGPSGSLLRVAYAGGSVPQSANAVHRFDLSSATNPASRVVSTLGLNDSYPSSALDTGRNGFWASAGNGQGPFKFVNFSTWAVTSYPSIGYSGDRNANLVYIPAPWDCLVGLASTPPGTTPDYSVWVCPIVANVPQGFVRATFSGSQPSSSSHGGVWSTILNCIVTYTGGGTTTVHKLTPPPPASMTTGTWVWTTETLTGANGATPSTAAENRGSWGRFVEAPALRCFIWCGSINQPAQAWRLQGM